MLEKCNSGIDLLNNQIGELYSGRTYLFAGTKATAKTTFALEFIWQGLKEGKTCLMLANQPPKEIVIYADSLGMDFSPYFVNGTLLIYEISPSVNLSPMPLYNELESIISINRISRASLECFGSAFTTKEHAEVLANGTSSFLRALEKMNVTTFFTMGLPLPQDMFMLKKTIEDLVAGSFVLSNTTSDRVKKLTVKKLLGSSMVGKELQFTIESGRGIVETTKNSDVKFPGVTPPKLTPRHYHAATQSPQQQKHQPEAPKEQPQHPRKRSSVSFSKFSSSDKAAAPHSAHAAPHPSRDASVRFPDKETKTEHHPEKAHEAPKPAPAFPAPHVSPTRDASVKFPDRALPKSEPRKPAHAQQQPQASATGQNPPAASLFPSPIPRETPPEQQSGIRKFSFPKPEDK